MLSVDLEESISKIHTPVCSGQKTMTLKLFSSSEVEPRYTTEDGSVLEGTIKVDMSDLA